MRKTSISRTSSRRRLLRRQRLALALAVVLASPAAFAGVVPACPGCLPEVGTVVSGTATSNLDAFGTMNPGPTTDNVMTITQTSSSAIIEWGTFSIDAGFTLNFIQPDANSVTLNRVIGIGYGPPTPSYIQGTITANGNVFIVNPTGILFGKSSVVNVGGLVASTLGISDTDFTTGAAMADPHYIFTPTVRAGAPIVNQGQLTAAAGGTIALLAARIENQAGATISTPGGSVVFGAARGVNLDFYDDGLTTVTLTGPGYTAPYGCAAGMSTSSCLGGIENSGAITALGGHVEMRTTTDDGLSQPVGTPYFTEASNGGRIWIGGTVTAQSSATRAGSIVLDAGMGNVDIGGITGRTGYVSANATGAGLNAGTVDINAYQLFTYVCVGPGGTCASNDSLGWIDASAYGAGGNGGAITINLSGDLYHAGVLQAGAAKGSGGLIDITAAGNAYIHNWITAEGLLGNGGTINIDAPSIYLYKGQHPWVVGSDTLYSQAVLSAYGSNNGGNVGLNFSTLLDVSDLGDVTPVDPEYAWIINVRGMNGNGGSITGTGGYLLDIGNTWFANANGYRDGGSIDLSAPFINIAGRLEAMGGRTTDLNVSFGDGGTISITGFYVDLYGEFYADGGSRVSPYPGPSSYGGSVIVSGAYVTLHDGSDFEAVGASGSGWVSTQADDALIVQGDVSVAAGSWYLGGTEGWVIPNASLGYYNNGVVVVDQALSTAVANGTSVSLVADPSMHSGTGSGRIEFVTGASVTGYGSWGALDFNATQGIYGNGFTIDANLWRVGMEGGSGEVHLENFTLDAHGGGVYLEGSYVELRQGDIDGWYAQVHATDNYGSGITLDATTIHASGGVTLDAIGTSGGIRLYNTSSITSDSGSVTLDASNADYGILVNDSTVQAGGGSLTLDASGSSDGGIHLYGGAALTNTYGDILLDASGSQAGILIDGIDITATGAITLNADYSRGGVLAYGATIHGGGDVMLSAHAYSGYSGYYGRGIWLDDSSITSTGGAIELYAGGNVYDSSTYSYTNRSIQIDDSDLTSAGVIRMEIDSNAHGIGIVSSDLNGGSIYLDVNGNDEGVHVDDSELHAISGGIEMYAYDSYDGVVINNSALYVDGSGGDIGLHADSSHDGIQFLYSSAWNSAGAINFYADNVLGGIHLENSTLDTSGGAGGILMHAGRSQLGVQVIDSSVLSKEGDINLYAYASREGVHLDGSMIGGSGHTGNVTLDAYGSRYGINVDASDIVSYGGDIELIADESGGILINNGSAIQSHGGAFRMSADFSPHGIVVDASTIYTGGGSVDVVSPQGPLPGFTYNPYAGGGIWLRNGAIIDSGDGDIRLDTSGGFEGIHLDSATIRSGNGDITLDASDNNTGIYLSGNALIQSQSGGVTLDATNSPGGIHIDNSVVLAGGGTLAINGNYSGGVQIGNASRIESNGGLIRIYADGSTNGLVIDDSVVYSYGGDIVMYATGYSTGGIWVQNGAAIDSGDGAVLLDVAGGDSGIYVDGSSIASGTGNITLDASSNREGITVQAGSSLLSTSGAITLTALGSNGGIMVDGSTLTSSTGGITLEADSDYQSGVHVSNSGIYSTGGDIRITGSSAYSAGFGVLIDVDSVISSGGGDIRITGADADGFGVFIEDTSLSSGGGAVDLQGTGGTKGGVYLRTSGVDSAGGDITISGAVTGYATGVTLYTSTLSSGAGSILIDGSTDGADYGVAVYQSSVASTTGDIDITGRSAGGAGLILGTRTSGSTTITTTTGNINLHGDGLYFGVTMSGDSSVASASGDVEIDGHGLNAAGLLVASTASVDAGSGTVVLRAGNDGNSDAIVIDGSITSTTAVNLRPLDETDAILLGAGNGFSVSSADLANIHSPWLVIGSAQQQGAIQVIDALVYDSNLTLQNQGGSAGIYLGAGVDVGLHTLGLLTGGSITQDADAAIHAESLLAIAAGDVLLAAAQNDVAGTTLSGSAGGVYEFLDANALAIGGVNAFGFDASGNVLAGQTGSGITAGSNVFVQALAGNLTLNGDVYGGDIDLITSGVLLNPGAHSLHANGSWRVWASTWIGEDRGGLAGNGSLPNFYNCTYGGPCGVTVGSGNHFIYTQQPTLSIWIDNASREYGDANPAFNYSASGLILGDVLANVLIGYLNSAANSGSNVGQYAINGNFVSPAGYAIAFVPGTGLLTITPATLLFTADPLLWYMGVPFPSFTGTVSGFKNGDTVASVFGNNAIWFTNATPLSMPGFYAIYGGSNAQNYVFTQAAGNQSALHLIPAAITSDQPTTFVSERNDTDVYDTNIGQVEMCPVSDSGNDQALEGGDALGGDWSKVRKRLNLLNCFSNDKKGGCSGSF